ncbi:F-box-like protein [Ceratobasidium sp. AG-Ba]|nr:F-box-like protein [Ceratobasidium sp. AG-Ba]QRW10814.1 F-box-like domain-containing protein [Ceratobasidium sp. AG-Ba]
MFNSVNTANIVDPSTKNDSILKSALTAWITARKLLSEAVVTYRSTHDTLRAVCVESSYSSSQHRLEEVFASIDAELNSISAEEQTLKDIRMSLLGLRNQSILLSPVNKLPPEIIGHIFSLSRKHCVFEGDKKAEPIYFTSVGSTHQLASLMLERTRNNPIHLHVYDEKLGPDRWAVGSEDRIGPTIAAIEPYIRRAYSLRIESLNHETELSSAILDLWFRNCLAQDSAIVSIMTRRVTATTRPIHRRTWRPYYAL